jgi:hypothetical protein
MGFFANFKAKRAAKRANAVYQTELLEWERENQVLTQALEIFTAASTGSQPDDQSLVQKKGELVLWTGQAIYQVAGRTPSTFSGGSQGVSIPLVAGIRFRVGSFKGQTIPVATTEWAFAKLLSSFSNPARTDFIFGVSNRQKSSGLRFSPEDGYTFAHLFALGLHSYENGIPATIQAIQNELKEGTTDKPMLELPPNL